jgi:dUTPase
MVISPYQVPLNGSGIKVVSNLKPTGRGDGGFGSTGR